MASATIDSPQDEFRPDDDQPPPIAKMLFSLTVGKVDAGVAVLLTEDKRLIEFPSILLPPEISSGSIVDISVARNFTSEAESQSAFAALQDEIYTTFGQRSPSAPILRCRNATQTSVVLEWDPIQLATAELRCLSLYRNGAKAGNIPKPLETQSTKISGLAIDTEYIFHLVLRTSAGTYSSQRLATRTHKMTDLSGITITPGVLPAPLRESLEKAVDRIGAKVAETVRIDTTHFVCTEGKGQQWERAVEMNIPVVRPEWVEGCEREGRLVGVREYYLNADPRLRQIGQGVRFQSSAPSASQLSSPSTSPRHVQPPPPSPPPPPRQQSTSSTPKPQSPAPESSHRSSPLRDHVPERTFALRKEYSQSKHDLHPTQPGVEKDENNGDDDDDHRRLKVGLTAPSKGLVNHNNDDDNDDDDDDDPEDDGYRRQHGAMADGLDTPEPKFVGDEPKARFEDRAQLVAVGKGSETTTTTSNGDVDHHHHHHHHRSEMRAGGSNDALRAQTEKVGGGSDDGGGGGGDGESFSEVAL